ncbi:MAG: cobalamin biosynthesis protein CbiG [Nostocales cyanobacterium]|nr:MAG: cobalamin biosynthesis protein CbiG [Nostocales cyanobacterium]
MQLDLSSSQILWVGIGCQKGSSSQLINAAIKKVFREYHLEYTDIAGIATIDMKASELGLIEFCQVHNLLIKTFTAEILADVCVPNPGKIIAETVGTPSVAEASAIVAASQMTSQVRLLVPKQIFSLLGEVGAVTVAVAGICNS